MQASERGKREQISEELWLSAMEWVRFHMHIVHWVADPYLAYMAADEDDLFHEAILAAVEALAAAEKKKAQQQFIPFFRVIFKGRCRDLAAGIQPVLGDLDSLFATVAREEEMYLPEPEREEIMAALKGIGGRREEVCAWILAQPRPVSTLETARHFQVSQRQVCRLLEQSLKQLAQEG